MNKLLEILNGVSEYDKIISTLQERGIVVNGLSDVQKRHFAASVAVRFKRPFVFVVQNDAGISNTIYDLSFLCGKEVELFPEENIFMKNSVKSKDIYIKRAQVLEKFLKNETPNLVIGSGVLLNCFPRLSEYKKCILHFKVGDSYDIDKVTENLINSGYERTELIEGVGQFAVRGGILDIYSPTVSNPVRIEFFDTEVDSIRSFDVMTQRAVEQMKEADIFPVKNEDNAEELISFIEYLTEDYMIFVEEPQRIADKIDTIIFENSERFNEENITPKKIFSREEIFSSLFKRNTAFLSTLETRLKDFSGVSKFSIVSRDVGGFNNSFETLYKSLGEWKNKNYRTVLLSGTEIKGKNISKELNERGLDNIYVKDLEILPNYGSVFITRGNLSGGFEYPDAKTVIISDNELFGRDKAKRNKTNKNKGISLNVDDLKVGDYIVHEKHGIGIYLGIETLNAGGLIKDYIKISYAKEDMLYIPVNQLDSVTKYIGADGRIPHINKMGGQDWAKVKARVRAGLKDVADKLVKLYAKREISKGFAFSPDCVWQKEFEDAFIYEETEDQLKCIEEIKRDMEKERPMDRLLCGDVGYGKTEVSIRAAFKAVMDGKQVAYLAPTTVLASQHYHSFLKRMKDYPVKIQVLSRLRSPKEQKEILKRLKSGEIDILVGTHKIIQKDVIFKDLGLLIIDEEQKFGVMAKEKIKMMRENVDVLTLTATPIPRTLHMSMVGVKDVSVIYEPPSGRSPVQTYVFEYDRGIIREAITREIERHGQVYYLYNKVEDIERVVNKLQEDLPWARIVYAHGKMSPIELEDIMMKFTDGEYDVLVCTTIIDSGMDIPNVNTIIIENAENLGLAQLYQLRGRVGRSDRIAYAYITYRKDRVLSEIATKRLNAIREFTEFGSGFKIAMRDLEIRGAGNLIGAEQHGHMDAVGYETYCRILGSMIREIKGEELTENIQESVEIELKVNAYISNKYISNEVTKMEMYQKISKVENEVELVDITDELADRFGDIPKETLRLLKVVEIKILAKQKEIIKIEEKAEKVVFYMKKTNVVDLEMLGNLMKKYKGRMLFSAGEEPYLSLNCDYDEDELLWNVKFVLQNVNLLNKQK